jgi:signal transduction histidine kinase
MTLARALAWLPRPLDPVRSIKMKIIMVLGAAGTGGMIWFTAWLRWFPLWTALTSAAVGVIITQFLAHGMTSPLREMTAAAQAMAHGDYSRRVRSTSQDEVGELASAFNQMASDLAAADRQRRELIANVSHELRTPISAVQAVLENIVDGVAAPDPTTLRTALALTERLGRLVTELLDLSRIEAGVSPLNHEEFRIADLLSEVAAEAEVAAAASGRDVTYTLQTEPEHATAVADRARLHQVITNLVDNASRHSPPGGTVTVRGQRDGDGFTLEVADQGPGIPHEERRRVFERFTRGERASGGGTGLGLAIANWVVTLHGGTIAVVDPSVHNGHSGCRIRVTLPNPALKPFLLEPAQPA